MTKAKWAVAWILIALAIIGIALLAGYTVGSDMAERDNRAEAR
jgi:hypothetical protein